MVILVTEGRVLGVAVAGIQNHNQLNQIHQANDMFIGSLGSSLN